MKEDDTKCTGSDHSDSTRAEGANCIKLPKLSIPKFEGDVLNWRTFWEQFGVSIQSRPQLSDAENLAYLKVATERWSCKARHSRTSANGRHLQ